MNVESVQMLLYLLQVSFITWVKGAGPCILFGLYYGLLSTLPIGPSQILSIRAFLLGGNTSGSAALSGLMVGQLILFLSIFNSPLYILIIKPHVITLLIVPYVIFFWFRTKDLSDYRVFRPIDSFRDFRIYNIFIDSFILQILNPILLPSPVLARLIHIFLFRYSNNVMFLMSSFLGWLVGHILFSHLSKLLLIRIESDSPILYLLIKRIIYKTFSILIFINVLLYLGKAPVSLLTNKFEDRLILLDTDFRQLPDLLLWMFKPWPTSSFDQYKPNRPIRYIENSRFSGNSPVKRQVSNHFFNRCLTDGKERLTFAVLPSLSIFEKQFRESSKNKNLDGSLLIQYSYKDWIWDQSRKNKALNNELKNRVKSLDTKSIFLKTIEKRTEFIDKNKGRLPRIYDPFLSNSYRVRTPISHSFWILCNLLELQTGDNNEYTGQSNYSNRIQDWISNRYQQLNCDKVPLPWETLPRSARRIFLFMFENSRDVRIQSIFKEMDLVYKENDNDPLSVTWQVTWEQVLKLPLAERALFFIYLKEDCSGFDWIDLLDMFSIHKEKYYSLEQKRRSIYKIEELLKELTHNTHLISNNRFDVVGGVTDIRNRKLKNLGITIGKTRLKTRKLMKRFSETSDFRRRLIKGSMRPRRRKILVWNLFQEKAHSPFFLRLIETPTRFQSSTGEFINSERLIIDAEQETNVQFEQELSSSSSLKNSEGLHSSIAARWDTGPIHTGRGLLLVLQSNLRKYVKLPILITLKNFGRIFLFQVPEWNEDWNQWHKESHINCTYDGKEFSDTELPGRWLKEGLQIKIVHPFELKPWHTHKGKQSTVRGKIISLKKNQPRKSRKKSKLEQGEFKATYLTIWGFQTDIPFGTIQKDPSFWKPIKKELIKTWKNSLSLGTKQINYFCSKLGIFTIYRSSLWKELNPFHRFKTIQENSNQTNGIGNNTLPDMKTKSKNKDKPTIRKTPGESIHLDNQSHSITSSDNRRVPDTLSGLESETKFGIYQSNNMMVKKIDKDERSSKPLNLNKVKIDRRLRNTDLTSSLRLKKQLVDIRRTSLIFRISMAKFFDKFLPIAILFQRINRIISNYYVTLTAFQIQLVGVIRDIFENDAKIQESTLVIPNTGRKTLQIDDNQSMRPLSQAYIYDNLWGISVRDSLDLNYLLEILKDSEDPKEPENNEQLDEDSNRDDNNEEQDSKEYNDASKNGNLPKKKRKYSKSIHDQNNREKEGLVECFDNRDKIIHKYIDEQIKNFTMAQGLFKQLLNINVNDCKIWLECFDRYNLPLSVWRKIAPYKWRVNAENLNRLEEIERSYLESQDRNRYVSYKKRDDYSVYTKNSSFRDRIQNLNKRRKYNHLLYSFVDSLQDANIQGSLMWKNAMKQEIRCNNCIKKLITRKGKKSFHQRISNPQSKLISKTDLVLWIIPDLMETRNAYETRSRFVPKTSILQKNLFHSFSNGQFQRLSIDYGFEQRKIQSDEMLLRERTSHYYIFQWKWKSEALERELQKFKDLISLSSVLENKPDITAFCINMGIDLDLLDLFFEKEKSEMLEDLFIVSAHRLSRIFDDQILMYKIVSILLKFGNRFKRRLDRDILDGCKPRLSLINRREKKRDCSYLYNVEDLLLPRRRRESRFLRSVGINKRVKCKEQLLDSTFQMQEGEESKDSSGTQSIKRFLWPSYRLEELACINRFCFNTSNGSRFAILKIRMYTII